MSYSFRKFEPFTDVLKPFDCGNADLNGFLLETSGDIPNATTYDRQLLASTYSEFFILLYLKVVNI